MVKTVRITDKGPCNLNISPKTRKPLCVCPFFFDTMCQTVLGDVLQAYLSCHSRPVIPHLASSCNYWVSRLSSSPASPTASYEPLPSGDTVHRCFDDHLPPVELHINFLVWLQSHFSLQSCILTYNLHLTCFASRAGFCPPALWFSVTLPHPVCLSLTPLLHDLSTACGLAVSILKGGGGWGGMLPCEGDNDCYHECEETVGIYYGVMGIKEGAGHERSSMP